MSSWHFFFIEISQRAALSFKSVYFSFPQGRCDLGLSLIPGGCPDYLILYCNWSHNTVAIFSNFSCSPLKAIFQTVPVSSTSVVIVERGIRLCLRFMSLIVNCGSLLVTSLSENLSFVFWKGPLKLCTCCSGCTYFAKLDTQTKQYPLLKDDLVLYAYHVGLEHVE